MYSGSLNTIVVKKIERVLECFVGLLVKGKTTRRPGVPL